MLEFSLSPLKTRLQVCTRADVAAAGHDRSDLRAMLRSGELVRLGRGWFGTSATPATVASALRRGHRLTCGSAVGLHGVFVPTLPAPHEVGRQCRCPESRLVVEHPPLRAWPDDEPIMPLRVAIRQALGCLEAWEVAVVLESALHRGLVTDDDVEEALAGVSHRRRLEIGRIDRRAMSGSETRVRRSLERRGVRVQPQYAIEGVGFIDMLVGDRLIIECDSVEHHTDAEAYARDRARDQACVQMGYLVVRLTYQDVMVRWEQTERLILDLIRQRVHLNPRRRRSA